MSVSKNDRYILRDLATQVADIAALPAQREAIRRWKALNDLKPVRPMVNIDQIPWHEMDVDGELTLRTTDEFGRWLETGLRQTLYRWKHMPVDMVVEPVINIPKVIRSTGYGIDAVEKKSVFDPNNDVVGHYYIDQFKNEDDIEKIQIPQLEHDAPATAKIEEQAREIFDGVLSVRMQGRLPMYNIWDTLVCWHGVENVLFDLVDRPEFMHKLMARFTDANVAVLDQLELKGLLCSEVSYIHCTGAFTDELPAPGFNPERPRAKDLWTCGMAQIFSSVSPAMHQEFELDYVCKLYERFGLVYYGCCEPLDEKIDIVRHVPHVRKISMSPWINVDKGAERIGRDYVFSRKPSPALLAVDDWNLENVKKDLMHTLDRCAHYGCPVEFILKDISTVRYQPQRLWEWATLAMNLVKNNI